MDWKGRSGTPTYDDVPPHMGVDPGMGMPGLRRMGVIGGALMPGGGQEGSPTYDDVPPHMGVDPGIPMPGLRKMRVIGGVELGVSAELFCA